MINKDLIKTGLFILLLFPMATFSQSKEANSIASKDTKKVWRINFLNPGIELEVPVSNNSTFSAGLGIGYGFIYPHTSGGTGFTYGGGTGFTYLISPFLDLQYKLFYNFEKRKRKNLTIDNNSGNFVSARLLT